MDTESGMNLMIKENLQFIIKTFITSFSLVVSVSSFAGIFPFLKAPYEKGKSQEDGKNYEITQSNKYLIKKESSIILELFVSLIGCGFLKKRHYNSILSFEK